MKADLRQQLHSDLLIESFAGLDSVDRDLLVFGTGAATPEIINRIFRVIHTIKGTAGCLGCLKIEKVAHVGENLLCLLRANQLPVSAETVNTLSACANALREMLRCLEASRTEGEKDYSELLTRLVALQTPFAPAAPATSKPAWISDPAPQPIPMVEAAPRVSDPAPLSASAVAAQPTAAGEGAARSFIPNTAIRVEVGDFDHLMNLVGELVGARDQITQHLNAGQDSSLRAVAQRLDHITSELQEGLMKARMQPIDDVISRFPSFVHDVAQQLGKRVRLEISGRETELDRAIIDSIRDPLTHVIRNSIDHGIECPDKRLKAGKPATGLLFIRAYHEGRQVKIEISDDGAGINVARVKQRSLDMGLITPEQVARMSEREAAGLVFLPGLSTADKVTHVSGRGVGMDVVKTNIERIGGSVDIQTQSGRGTTIKFKIPLTLAAIPELMVSAGGGFAIPQVHLPELLRGETDAAEGGIERIFGAPVHRLPGEILPLVKLKRTLEADRRPACGHHRHLGGTGEVSSRAATSTAHGQGA